MVGLEAERAGHAAASRRCHGYVEPQALQHGPLLLHSMQGLLMAVSLQNQSTLHLPAILVEGLRLQEGCQEEGLPAESARSGIVGEELQQLIREYRGTARLQHDHRRPRINLRTQGLQNSPERSEEHTS